ncbi:hypothetical protein LOK49_LG01G03143 [Camellia lanceoleosa]|uniref:Uncharacterized protein n=1 Tax=Camellia lanceoleosa TaxID=1840588 RepID=A0ACC0IYP8_9ERIC|nr:hypothetical protein LOK49_LG01G03143 [Camellia lanceoleosa]
MTQNMTVKQLEAASGLKETQPNGQPINELSKDKEAPGYGPWTIATTRRKYPHGKFKQKNHVHKSNRFESLQMDQDHGETSAAQSKKEVRGKYVDLDMGPQSFQGEGSHVQQQGPIGPSIHMKEGGTDLSLDVVAGAKNKESYGCVSPASTQQSNPQPSSFALNAPENPKTLPDNTAQSLVNSPNVLNPATASDNRMQLDKEKHPDLPIRREGRPNGGNGRKPSHGRTQSGPMQSPDVLRDRERSVSPSRHRLVARRGEAPDSTMVGDRFTQREAHGASETSEANGGRSDDYAQNVGTV